MSATRPRLLIVDQSLRDLDGHHLEYDASVAAAARACGLDVLIAAHRSCDPDLVRGAAALRPYFDKAWNEGHLGARARLARVVIAGLPAALRAPVLAGASRLRRRLGVAAAPVAAAVDLPDFGRTLLHLIAEERLGAGDHVLVHTLSIPELHALVVALSERHAVASPTLHIVLRRDAEEPDVARDAWGGVAACLRRIAADVRLRGNVRVYADTEALCEQYAALAGGLSGGPSGGLAVRLLPIPHELPQDRLARPHTPGAPVRAVYLGNARSEKGFHLLPDAVAALSGSHAAAGRLAFVLQANASFSLEEPQIAAARRRLAKMPGVTLLGEAQTIEEFQAHLLASDLALLPYEAARYRRRSSGILVQAIACGVPVVVPAGTWMEAAAPPAARISFNDPAGLAAAIATAVDRIAALQAAARAAAPAWRRMHSADALVASLLERC